MEEASLKYWEEACCWTTIKLKLMEMFPQKVPFLLIRFCILPLQIMSFEQEVKHDSFGLTTDIFKLQK